MAKLNFYEVEEREVQVKGAPKKVKKCVIQEDGKQYPYKNVTVWEDYPEYAGVQAGAKFDHSYVDARDSDQINPNSGKPYKNYTLKYGAGASDQQSGGSDSFLLRKMDAKLDTIIKIVGGNQPVKPDDTPSDEINPDDIPF